MRLVLIAIVCLAAGFGAGWAVFEKPWQGSDGNRGLSPHDVQVAALRHDGSGYQSAECTQREYPTNLWDCSLLGSGTLPLRWNQRITVYPDGSMRFGKLDLARG